MSPRPNNTLTALALLWPLLPPLAGAGESLPGPAIPPDEVVEARPFPEWGSFILGGSVSDDSSTRRIVPSVSFDQQPMLKADDSPLLACSSPPCLPIYELPPEYAHLDYMVYNAGGHFEIVDDTDYLPPYAGEHYKCGAQRVPFEDALSGASCGASYDLSDPANPAPLVAITREVARGLMIDTSVNAIDRGATHIMIDEAGAVGGLFSWDDETSQSFAEWLDEEHADELGSLGVDTSDPAWPGGFDFAGWLQAERDVWTDTDVQDLLRADPITSPAHAEPMLQAWLAFHLDAERAAYEELRLAVDDAILADPARAGEEARVTFNRTPDAELWQVADFSMSEPGTIEDYPDRRLSWRYKLHADHGEVFFSWDAAPIATPGPCNADLVPFELSVPDTMRLFAAEALVTGGGWVSPGTLRSSAPWFGEDSKLGEPICPGDFWDLWWDRIVGPQLEEAFYPAVWMADHYPAQFGHAARAEVLLLFSLENEGTYQRDAFESVAHLLEDAQIQYRTAVFGGGLLFPDEHLLAPETLDAEFIVLPNAYRIDDESRSLLLTYVWEGGNLVLFGEPGNVDDWGRRLDVPSTTAQIDWSDHVLGCADPTSCGYGAGQIFWFRPDGPAALYDYGGEESSAERAAIRDTLLDTTGLGDTRQVLVADDFPPDVAIHTYDDGDELVIHLLNYERDDSQDLVTQSGLSLTVPGFSEKHLIQGAALGHLAAALDAQDPTGAGDEVEISIPDFDVMVTIRVGGAITYVE